MINRDKEFYRFLFSNIARAILYFGIIAGIFFLFRYFVGEEWQRLLEEYGKNPPLIFLIFFLSETFFGIFPPEFFVIWAGSSTPAAVFILRVILLAVLSYLGGAIIAFNVGKWLRKSRIFRGWLMAFFKKYVRYYHKWGFILIILSALTPMPFATVSLISGMFNYDNKSYYLFSSVRFLRFAFYAFAWLYWGRLL